MIGLCPTCRRWFKVLSAGSLAIPTPRLPFQLAVHPTPNREDVCDGTGQVIPIEQLKVEAPYFDARELR